MPNPFFTNSTDLLPNTRARAGDVESKLEAVEAGFDEAKEYFDRTLRGARANPAIAEIPDAATRANKVLVFDVSGNPAVAVPTDALNAVSRLGDTMTGALSVPAGATGTQVPRAQDVVLLTGNQTAAGTKTFSGVVDVTGRYQGGVTAVAALDVDCSAGNYFTKTINGASAFTFSNAPSAKAYSFTLELTHTSGAVTWPAAVQWPNGTAPTLTTGKTHLFVFVTDDGGTRWRGASSINYTN